MAQSISEKKKKKRETMRLAISKNFACPSVMDY
jgi:hypothetical protein